jgi:Domain of unknown function DUF11
MKHHRGFGRRLPTCLAALAGAIALFCVGTPAGTAAYGGYGFTRASDDATADLAVTIADSADPVEVGGQVDYKVTIRDLGPADAARIHVQFVVPQGLELLSVTGARRCDSDAAAFCTLGVIPSGQSADVVFGVRATTPGTFTVVATATSPWPDPKPESNTARESTQVNPPARLQVIEHVVNDDGGSASARDFAIGVDGANAQPSAFAGDEQGITVALDPGQYGVHVGAKLGYETALSPECQGTIARGENKTCKVTSDDLAPLTLTLTADKSDVAPGARVRYTATLTNRNHQKVVARSLAVALPGGFAYRAGSTQGVPAGDPQIAGQTLTWAGPFDVPAGGSTSSQFIAVAPTAPGEYVATTNASVDSPYTVAPGTGGAAVKVVASQTGPPQPAPNPPAPQPAPAPAANPAPAPAGPAPPVFQESADLEPVEGDVFVRLPGTSQFVRLDAAIQAPLGTEVDTSSGKLALSTVDAAGTRFHADFSEGRFKIARQLVNGTTELRLTGGDFRSCGSTTRAFASVDKKKPKPPKRKRSRKIVRHLWGSGKGKFQTRGRYLAATVHGTKWLTEDRCDASRAFVQEGVVAVRDLVKRKTIEVSAGHGYVARPRR